MSLSFSARLCQGREASMTVAKAQWEATLLVEVIAYLVACSRCWKFYPGIAEII